MYSYYLSEKFSEIKWLPHSDEEGDDISINLLFETIYHGYLCEWELIGSEDRYAKIAGGEDFYRIEAHKLGFKLLSDMSAHKSEIRITSNSVAHQ